MMAYMGRSAWKGLPFSGQFMYRVGISLVEVYQMGGKWPKGLNGVEFYGFIKLKKRSIFVTDSYLKDSAFTAVEG